MGSEMCIRDRFYFRTTDVTGEVELPAGTEMVMPGDDAKFTVKLITPIAMAVVMSLFFLLLDQVLKFFLELLLKVSI